MSQVYKDALLSILKADRVDVIKEIAADALDVDVTDYLDEDELEEGDIYLDIEDPLDEKNPQDVLSMFE
jgi:hypothetical protein